MQHRPFPAPRYPASVKVSLAGVPGYFAGEATHEGMSGTVAGAIASGYRAADEIA